tara:strand:+ start:76 stop:372 length:297 start_codon:yes stop_codon:yes gene_type:complete
MSNFELVNSGRPDSFRHINNANDCLRAWKQVVSAGESENIDNNPKTVVTQRHKDFPHGCGYSKTAKGPMILRFNPLQTTKPCSTYSRCILFKDLDDAE